MSSRGETPEWLIKRAAEYAIRQTLTLYPVSTFFGPAGASMTREEIEGLAYEDGAREGYIAGYLAALNEA